MSYLPHLRMLGYSVTLVMHGINIVMMKSALQGPVMEDDDVKTFAALHLRFFTVWTFEVQIAHAVLGLVCDYLTLKNSGRKGYRPPKYLKSFKNRLFAGVLWPTVFLVSTMFWSLYHFDRSLIYPLFADKILTSTANHIVHTAIVPIVLYEVMLQPREVPRSHALNIANLTVYMLVYLSLMYYTYLELGVWMYPIFGMAHNTIYFPMIIGFIGIMLFTYYHLQWYLTALIWSDKKTGKKL